MAVRSKTSVCGRSFAGIASSSLNEGIYVRFLCVLCAVHLAASEKAVLPGGCVQLCDLEPSKNEEN